MPRLKIRYAPFDDTLAFSASGASIELPPFFTPRALLRAVAGSVSVLCFLWASGDFMARRSFQAESQTAFVEASKAFETKTPIVPVAPAPASPVRIPVIAKLNIPRLGVSGFVQEGFDASTLHRAIGHYPASAKPGAPGNVVLAAHRDTFFSGLRDTKKGDEVLMEDTRGATFVYRVTKVSVVRREDATAMHSNPRAASRKLTLITCYPFTYVGPAPDRMIVEAELVSSRAKIAQRREQI